MTIIRKGTYEDLASVVHITVICWNQTYKGLLDDEYLASMNEKEMLKQQQMNFADNLLVLEDHNNIVGFIRYGESELYENKGQIYALYILSEYQKFGFGKKLLFNAFDILKMSGYSEIVLGCLVDNPANGFYDHLGGKLFEKKDSKLGEMTISQNMYIFKI